MSHFYSADKIFECIKSIEEDLRSIAFSVTYRRYGNRLVDDIIQDTYIKSCTIFLNSNLVMYEFFKEVKAVCTEISWEYFWEEKKNYAKPSFALSRSGGDDGNRWDLMGSDAYFELMGDESNSGERKMIALEELSAITEIKGQWLNFNHAKEFVHLLRIRSREEWDKYCKSGKKIKNIPQNPEIVYKNFKGWDDWFGNKYFNYEECCNWVQNNVDILKPSDWNKIKDKLPKEIPSDPELFYKESGWYDWYSFLVISNDEYGTKYLPYKDAMYWVQQNLWKFQLTMNTWDMYLLGEIKDAPPLPDNIPPHPDIVYKNTGWVSWYVWFGRYKDISRKFPISYFECRNWVKQNIPTINTKEQWDVFIAGNHHVKRPEFLPPNPDAVFRNRGWCGWNMFLMQNGMNKKWIDGVFNVANIRINYCGEKIWVTPISIFQEKITAKVITMLAKSVKGGEEIQFDAKDICQMPGLGNNKTKNKLSTYYKMSV